MPDDRIYFGVISGLPETKEGKRIPYRISLLEWDAEERCFVTTRPQPDPPYTAAAVARDLPLGAVILLRKLPAPLSEGGEDPGADFMIVSASC